MVALFLDDTKTNFIFYDMNKNPCLVYKWGPTHWLFSWNKLGESEGEWLANRELDLFEGRFLAQQPSPPLLAATYLSSLWPIKQTSEGILWHKLEEKEPPKDRLFLAASFYRKGFDCDWDYALMEWFDGDFFQYLSKRNFYFTRWTLFTNPE